MRISLSECDECFSTLVYWCYTLKKWPYRRIAERNLNRISPCFTPKYIEWISPTLQSIDIYNPKNHKNGGGSVPKLKIILGHILFDFQIITKREGGLVPDSNIILSHIYLVQLRINLGKCGGISYTFKLSVFIHSKSDHCWQIVETN